MLQADRISVSFGETEVLRDVTVEAQTGETLALLGPSGCGKTTLLRTIAGLQRPDAGRIVLDGEDLTSMPPHERRIGLMFQEHVLFPHRDVAGNIAFGLRATGRSRGETDARVRELLALVGLPWAAQRAVQTLSGGEQQRVALARALAPSPRALLLDEPLGSLDGPLRERLVDELRELFARLAPTVLYVTHDVGEAFALGHRVAVLRDGGVVQIGTPDEIWSRPADAWTARFLGIRNVFTDGGKTVIIRPEAVRLTEGSNGVVLETARRGAVVRLRVRTSDGRELDAVTTALVHPAPGAAVGVEVDPAGVVELT